MDDINNINDTNGKNIVVRRVGNRDNRDRGNDINEYDGYLNDNDIVAVNSINIYKMRFAWKYWKREFLGLKTIEPFIAYREKKIKQKVNINNIFVYLYYI